MQDIQVWDVKEADYDPSEMAMSELPLVPSWFSDALLEAGGTCDGKPNVRVVSGLDPSLTEFYGGRWWRKYAFREHIENRYTIYHTPDGKKRIISDKEAEILGKQKNLKGILLPVVDQKILEYGIPRYFVEYYQPPEYFGTEEAWNHVRYDQDSDTGQTIDLMGDFPRDGVYTTWFSIEDLVEKDGKVTGTKFRPLDDVVLEFIKHKITEAKNTSAVAKHNLQRKKADEEYLKRKKELKEDIKDIVSSHIDRLMD